MRECFRLQPIFFFEFVDSVAGVVWNVRCASAVRTAEAIEQCYGIVVYPVSCKRGFSKMKLERKALGGIFYKKDPRRK